MRRKFGVILHNERERGRGEGNKTELRQHLQPGQLLHTEGGGFQAHHLALLGLAHTPKAVVTTQRGCCVTGLGSAWVVRAACVWGWSAGLSWNI